MSLAGRKDAAERALKLYRQLVELPALKRLEVLALLQVMLQAEAATPSPQPAPNDVVVDYTI